MYILIALFNVDVLKENERTVRSYNRAVLQSVFSFRLPDVSLCGGVYIDALLQPYSKHLPIKKSMKKLPLKYPSCLLCVRLFNIQDIPFLIHFKKYNEILTPTFQIVFFNKSHLCDATHLERLCCVDQSVCS